MIGTWHFILKWMLLLLIITECIAFLLLQDNYNTYRNNVGALLGSPKREQLTNIGQEIETHTDVSKQYNSINENMRCNDLICLCVDSLFRYFLWFIL